MPYTEAQKKATMKYQKENYEQYLIRLPMGRRQVYTEHAEIMGESLAAFIRRALEETMKRDRARIRETMKNAPKPAEPEEE